MRVAVIGSGGREHAIIKSLNKSPLCEKLFAIPGNGGMEEIATCVPIGVMEFEKIKDFILAERIDFCVVAPDDPLAGGLVDILEGAGVKCFGPRANAAIIEASKVFSKNLMKKYSIPTAKYEVFEEVGLAINYLKNECDFPIVLKADGLALGKGVIIAENLEDAITAVQEMMEGGKFGNSGKRVVIEEFLTGPEVSVLAFTDGNVVVPMVSSMDHKRIGDNDTGLNTGGMGTVAPNPYYTKSVEEECMQNVFIPTINAMNAEGRKFKGCLYFGLMVTPKGVKVIEYNCRFGDPETQVVLPLLKSDLLEVMLAVSEERLKDIKVEFSTDSACCLILASNGYPESYKKGYEITVGDITGEIYYAGAKMQNGKLLTNGGRVLGITNTAKTLKDAIEKSYLDAKVVNFENAYCRKDIGQKALKALGEK